MNRKLLTLSLLIAVVCSAQAKPRTGDQMRSAAAQALSKYSAAKGMGNATKTTDDLEVLKEAAQLTVIGYKTGGYAVIANDDNFTAVLGYSDTPFTDNMPPAFTWWLNTMNESLEQMLAKGETMQPVKRAAEYKESVANVVTTTWNQDSPYNNLCPTFTNSSNQKEPYVTGCVATAMAQILKYHEYPVKGSGSKSYRWTPEDGSASQTVNAIFRNTTYDYANMLDSYTGSYTDAQATAVATLMKHCGVSVEMQYAQDGSGAYISEACTALKKYFTYDQYIKYYNRIYFPKDEWMNIVYRELSDECPILYGGQSSSGGHAFVFCGYDADGKVYVNWGWGGSGDGYFEVASLSGYSSGQEMVIVRLPDDERYTETYRSLWCVNSSTPMQMTISGSTVSMSATTVYNMDVDDFTGAIDLVAMNMETGEVTKLSNVINATSVEFLSGYSLSETASVADLPDGKYRIYLATKSTSPEETEYQPVRGNESTCNSYILEKSGDNVTLSADNSGNWTANITTAISSVTVDTRSTVGDDRTYNVYGQRVGDDYKGVIIKNGKKFIRK